MGDVIKFPIARARKSRRQLEEEMASRYVPLAGGSWTSDLEMVLTAAQDLANGVFKSSGCVIIFYDPSATTIYRRGLEPDEVEALVADYVTEFETGMWDEDEPA